MIEIFTNILVYLMELCYKIIPNYILSVILFTFITKIILFPLSLWCQKNSITMVALMPDINRLKAKFYGDNERISEEQARLYKEKHYHPFLSIVPLAIQIIILAGMMEAIHSITDTGASVVLGLLPYKEGGVTWLVPLAAGATAFILGAAQNKINPLQREQSKVEQWMTNGISIAISLSLGFFVALGVALYWMVSNLSSILVQWVCNLIIPAKKYVDYQTLKESKKSLTDINALGGKASLDDKRREKADYKRFFTVANKHLVFYSESSGFYKYFKNLIDALLRRSNVTIHYVTSDPKDQIFALAKKQPRIRPYYIGEKKLITLMMKMDADIVVMTTPDLDKYYMKRSLVRKDVEYIYTDHGMTSLHMCYREGALDAFDTVFCVGPHQQNELRAMEKVYGLPEKRIVEAGYGLLDTLIESYTESGRQEHTDIRILIAPSWQDGNILDSCLDQLMDQLFGQNYQIIIRPHPEYKKRFPLRINELLRKYGGREMEGVLFESDFSSNVTIFTADLVITDWSGIAYEFSFTTHKPSLFINTPMKVVNPNYEKVGLTPVDILWRDEAGLSLDLDELDKTGETVETLLISQGKYEQRITDMLSRSIFNIGSSGEAGCRYILKRLQERTTHSHV